MADWPREHDATVAVEAAARKAFEDMTVNHALAPAWDDLGMDDRRKIKEAVLPTVWAALSALPDPRLEAWLEGHSRAVLSGPNSSSDVCPY